MRFVGVAGPKVEAAGCEVWAPLETLAIRGFTEVMSRVPELWRLRRALGRRLLDVPIAMFIGVDAPDFNLGLERHLKRHRVRTVHFVSPSVWAWRRERIGTIKHSADRLLALFPFEPPLYEAAGVPVTYVGHPLAHDAATPASRRAAREQLKLGIAQPVFALCQGAARASWTCTAISSCRRPPRSTRRSRTRVFSFHLPRAPHARPIRRRPIPSLAWINCR